MLRLAMSLLMKKYRRAEKQIKKKLQNAYNAAELTGHLVLVTARGKVHVSLGVQTTCRVN
jgi:hypothetical protein